MKSARKTVCGLALAALVAAPLGFYFGLLTLDTVKLVMLVATLVWFPVAGWGAVAERGADDSAG